MADFKETEAWAIRTNNPKALEFLAKGNALQGFYSELSYPTRIVSIWDKSDPSDKGTEYERKVCDKLCKFEDGSVLSLCWDWIYSSEEEAKAAFKEVLKGYGRVIEDIKRLEAYLDETQGA